MGERNLGYSGQTALSGDTEALLAPPQCGRLVSFDTAELSGWIGGDDGNLYFFSSADVVGDVDIAIGQSVSFCGSGELAFQVTGLGGGALPVRSLCGRLVSFDSSELSGSIVDDEGQLYHFSAADVVGTDDIAVGQSVVFSAAGEIATQVCRAGDPVAPVPRALSGKLVSFDPADLGGWIGGDDGNLYYFSSADVVDDRDIAVGQSVRFSGAGERAFEVSGVDDGIGSARVMRGKLISFELADLGGWIVGDDGEMYCFTVAEVLGDDEIVVGQSVTFLGSGEFARQVRKADDGGSAMRSLHGRLISFDSAELMGWIADHEGGLHHFSAADVVGDKELLIGQSVAFVTTGEVATDVTGLGSGDSTPARSLRGKLLSFDPQELTGWVEGDGGGLHCFSAADVVGDQDLVTGQAVTFSASGEVATEVTAVGGDSAAAQDLSGKLISFDVAELSGWIEGDDGVLYAFSAADVLGDEDIAVGQAVEFSGAGEMAYAVRKPSGGTAGAGRPLRGKLISFDEADLSGWLVDDDGELYHFSAADVVGDQDIAIGQSVAFSGVGEFAFAVTGLGGRGVPGRGALRGRLVSFDANKLSGSIVGDDGLLYSFTAAEVLGHEDIAVGSMVSFSAAGEQAYQISAEGPSAGAPAARPASAPQSVPHTPPAPAPQAVPSPAAARPAVPVQPLLQASETSGPQSSRLLVAGLIGAILVGGLAILYVQNQADSVGPAAAKPEIASADVVAAPEATTPAQNEAPAAGVEVMPATQPAPETAAEPGITDPDPALSAAQTETAAAPPAESNVAAAGVGAEAAGSSTSEFASIEPAVAAPTPRPVAAKPKKPVAWWLAPRPGNLDLVYAGHLADSPAIVLRFDGVFADADAAARHITVTRSDGSRPQGKWALGPNGQTLILRVPPGSYKVVVGPELADADGSVLGARMSGPIQVR
ncbi:MAG: hypothetical protein ACT4QA_14150 [Panacagrimonas sp.]